MYLLLVTKITRNRKKKKKTPSGSKGYKKHGKPPRSPKRSTHTPNSSLFHGIVLVSALTRKDTPIHAHTIWSWGIRTHLRTEIPSQSPVSGFQFEITWVTSLRSKQAYTVRMVLTNSSTFFETIFKMETASLISKTNLFRCGMPYCCNLRINHCHLVNHTSAYV